MEFKYDVRDLKFILKEWLPTEEVLACERFKGNFSIDDVDMLLNEGYKVSQGNRQSHQRAGGQDRRQV